MKRFILLLVFLAMLIAVPAVQADWNSIEDWDSNGQYIGEVIGFAPVIPTEGPKLLDLFWWLKD